MLNASHAGRVNTRAGSATASRHKQLTSCQVPRYHPRPSRPAPLRWPKRHSRRVT